MHFKDNESHKNVKASSMKRDESVDNHSEIFRASQELLNNTRREFRTMSPPNPVPWETSPPQRRHVVRAN